MHVIGIAQSNARVLENRKLRNERGFEGKLVCAFDW